MSPKLCLKYAHVLLELVDPGADGEVRAGREEHLWRHAQVKDHTGVPVKGLGIDSSVLYMQS